MSQFYINPGELRTPIRVQKQVATGAGSFKTVAWVDLGNASDADPPRYIMARWEGLKGIEKWMADSIQTIDTAMATIRFNSSLTAACRILSGDMAYQIVDVTDPTQHKQWLQISVKAAVNG